ncbi:MAG: GNAT family N-acetyltransferase [Actinomycetota bacterium]|nr:GNAT family N-acetyltransferase [Actinomycetota bacterium]
MADLAWIEGPVGLRDGRQVRIRAVCADDEAAMLALLESLSLESRQRRFFSVAANLAEAARLASHSTWPEAVGLIALADDSRAVVAHALAIRCAGNENEAEVAFEVAEAYHGDGLATLLLIRLAALAEAHGITHFVADVLPENHPMLAVFHHAFGGRASNRSGVVDIRFATCDWPQARARFDPEPTDPTNRER